MKFCKRCNVEKNISEFTKNRNVCKSCNRLYKKAWRLKNRKKLSDDGKVYRENNKEHIQDYLKEYYINNEETLKEYRTQYTIDSKLKIDKTVKDYYEVNKHYISLYQTKYRNDNKESINFKIRLRKLTEPLFKLRTSIRTSLWYIMNRGGYAKNDSSLEIIGCSFEDLLLHLNDNEYGFIYSDDNIDIDHIIPLSSAKDEEELLSFCHYTNLQLLPSRYNRHIKSNNAWSVEHFENWLLNI